MEKRDVLLKQIAAALIVCGKSEWDESTVRTFQKWMHYCIFQTEESELKQLLAVAQSQYKGRPRCLYFCGCLSRYEAQNGFPLAPDEYIPVVATECLGECKHGSVAVLRRDSAEVMVAGFGAQYAVDQIRHFAMQAFDETDIPLHLIPFRHYPG